MNIANPDQQSTVGGGLQDFGNVHPPHALGNNDPI